MEHIRVSKIENVTLVDRFHKAATTVGNLFVTTTHLIYRCGDVKEKWILLSLIDDLDKGQLTASGCLLTVRCKTFLVLQFLIPKEKDAYDLFATLQLLSRPSSLASTYAYNYVCSVEACRKGDAWEELRSQMIEKEYQRQDVPNANWSASDLNDSYTLCDTYPCKVFFPATASTPQIMASAAFRSRARLPVLAYHYKANGAAILRCAQPLAGFAARCIEDEQLFDSVLKSNPSVSDTILVKLVEALGGSASNVSSFLTLLDSSGWLRHIRSIIECGAFIADAVSRGISCVVHCSDGWDRTAQTISVACLLLDPYYRTLDGFKHLVCMQWLSFGHKFSDRCGHLSSPSSSSTDTAQSPTEKGPSKREQSPVFTQFLDCVYQLTNQFPRHFEFNVRYLVSLHEVVHSCAFGTFLCNSQRERLLACLPEHTYSAWPFLEHYSATFLNPMYEASATRTTIKPLLRLPCMNVFVELYNRHDTGVQVREDISEIIRLCQSQNLHDVVQLVRAQVRCASTECTAEFGGQDASRLVCLQCSRHFCRRCVSITPQSGGDAEMIVRCAKCAATAA